MGSPAAVPRALGCCEGEALSGEGSESSSYCHRLSRCFRQLSPQSIVGRSTLERAATGQMNEWLAVSVVLNGILLCGGLWKFQNRKRQHIYDFAYAGILFVSVVCCLLSPAQSPFTTLHAE